MRHQKRIVGQGCLLVVLGLLLGDPAWAQNDGYTQSNRVFNREENTRGSRSANGNGVPAPANRQPTFTPTQQAAPGNGGMSAQQRQSGNRGAQNANAQGGQPGQNRRARAQQPGVPGGAVQGQPGGGATQIGGAPGGGGKGGGGGAAGFTMVGKIPEVSKGLADSLRTKRVDFDSKKAGREPNVILFGARKLDPKETEGREDRALAKPL